MLTPGKIANHHFEASGRNAYKAESVDTFLKEVVESFDQMFRENGEMYKKINLLAQRLEEYRKDEDNIRNALITAQRAAERITREAQEKADKLVAEVQERTDTENAKLDAAAKEILSKAKYQADSIVEEAQKQAKEIVEKAVVESKEASVNARSDMIKELAALETMKQEVTKFKQQILGQYAAQLELIKDLPEVVIEKMTEEEKKEEAPTEEPVEDEPVAEEPATEEPAVEEPVTEEPTAEAPVEEKQEEPAEEEKIPFDEAPEEVKAPEAREAESMDVEHLQQMIYETEDTDAESDPAYADEEDETTEPDEEPAEFVVPDIDDASDEELEKIVDDYGTEQKSEPQDIMFTKPKKESDSRDGFRLKFENIDSFATDDRDNDYLDDLDDDDLDDDGNDGGLAGKIKGFFKK